MQQRLVRVSRSRPCPICGKPDWCLLSPLDPPSRAICARTESPRRAGEAGWLHVLRDDDRPGYRARTIRLRPAPAQGHMGELAEGFRAKVTTNQLARLAGELGVGLHALQRLGTGWTGWAWSFPMTDAAGGVRGIRLRRPDGHKLAVRGGHEGLFLPQALRRGQFLLIAEGPTDTAALLSLGLDAVGRPSCLGGVSLLVDLVRLLKPATVAMVADSDAPGIRGAWSAGAALRVHCRDVRVVMPPAPHKDARAWVNAGAARDAVEAAICAGDRIRTAVTVRSVSR